MDSPAQKLNAEDPHKQVLTLHFPRSDIPSGEPFRESDYVKNTKKHIGLFIFEMKYLKSRYHTYNRRFFRPLLASILKGFPSLSRVIVKCLEHNLF